jgi:hypothetical protein
MATIRHHSPDEYNGDDHEYSEYSEDDEDYEETLVEDDVAYDTGHHRSTAAESGGMAAIIAAAANQRKQRQTSPRYTQTIIHNNQEVQDAKNFAPSSGGGMAAMIAAAASKRNKRIDDGGEIKVREVAPPPEKAPDKQDFAAKAAAAASKRNNRIESGGAVRITEVRDIPEEHCSVYVSIAEEAANMGRLVRMNEHVVEAESLKRQDKDTWSGPGGLKNSINLRSTFEKAISEAAALGRLRAPQQKEISSIDRSRLEVFEEDFDIDRKLDKTGQRELRSLLLMDQHVEEEKKEKKDQWSSLDKFDIPVYNSLDEVELPTERLPSFKPKQPQYVSQRDALEAISNAVAAAAWDRTYRLRRRKAQLKVTKNCSCPYCKNPNPYQTHKYKKMMSGEDPDDPEQPKSKWHPDNAANMTHQVELPHYLEAPTKKIYQSSRPNDEAKEAIEHKRPPKPIKIWQPPKDDSCPPPVQEETKPTTLQPQFVPDPHFVPAAPTSTGGTRILLDETIDFGTRRRTVHIKKEKKNKDENKRKKMSKKSKKEEGCLVM